MMLLGKKDTGNKHRNLFWFLAGGTCMPVIPATQRAKEND
jgi:hypothetical protein